MVDSCGGPASSFIERAIATGSSPTSLCRHAFIHATKDEGRLSKWEKPGTTSSRNDLKNVVGLFGGDLLYGLDIVALSTAQMCDAWDVGVRSDENSTKARNYAISDAEVLLVPNVPRDAIKVLHHN